MDDDFLDGIRFLNKKRRQQKITKQKLMQAKISETKKIVKLSLENADPQQCTHKSLKVKKHTEIRHGNIELLQQYNRKHKNKHRISIYTIELTLTEWKTLLLIWRIIIRCNSFGRICRLDYRSRCRCYSCRCNKHRRRMMYYRRWR